MTCSTSTRTAPTSCSWTATYDQIHIPEATVGDTASYLLENQTAQVATHEGTVLYVELPASVVLEITYTEPGLQGDRSTGGTKPATLEIRRDDQRPAVPLETGTKVKVDTRDGLYLGSRKLTCPPAARPQARMSTSSSRPTSGG